MINKAANPQQRGKQYGSIFYQTPGHDADCHVSDRAPYLYHHACHSHGDPGGREERKVAGYAGNGLCHGGVTIPTWKGYVLPVVALGGYSLSYLSRLMRSSLLEVMGQDCDGSPLTAADYVYSALRVLTPETTSQYVNMISDYVVNGQEYYDGTAAAEDVGIKAVDDNTLEFTLKAPCAYFVDLEKNEHYWDADKVTLEKVNLHCGKEPYNNPLVRKALNLAIDREALISNVAQIDAEPAFSFLAPGYVVDGKDILEGRSDFGLSAGADVEGAKAALAEAGYPEGEGFPTLQLSFYSDDNVKKIAEAIKEMWEQNLGIQVKTEKDPVKSAELVKQADDVVSSDYPVLPLYYKANNFLIKDYVQGVYMTSSAGLYLKDAKVVAK